jgi:agmatine deiminase
MQTPRVQTPNEAGFSQPAEWALHDSCWLAWPSHGDLWKEGLAPAQEEFLDLCRSIIDIDPETGQPRGESIDLLVPDESVRLYEAKKALRGLPVRFHSIPFGDIWVRDTACIFVTNATGAVANVRFGFNGWGGKYRLPFDDQVSTRISGSVEMKDFTFPWVLEGGSIEVDGEGTCLTTRQCLLNENRNPGMSQAEVEAGLRDALGVTKTLWLRDGLLNDHTDGHIDTLARFVAPGVVVCMKALDPSNDPNHEIYEEIARDLASFTDARGRKLQISRVPSPGRVTDEDGRIMPASFMNFYIGNSTVVVPTYGTVFDDAAVAALAPLFPKHRVVGCSAFAILSGGGAFHCITQQQPKGTSK